MLVKGGFSTYGQPLGVIMFKGITPRIPGDLGHAETLDYHIRYEVLDTVGFMNLVEGSERAKGELIAAAKRLEARGVRAVTGDCGLLVRYQQEIACMLKVPFFSSSLLLVPLIWQLQGKQGKIGIVTGHSDLLTQEHLHLAGIPENIPLAIAGMEKSKEFTKVVIDGAPELNVDMMKDGVLEVCRELVNKNPKVRSLVLECSNLSSFAKDIYDEINLPVYDVIGLAKLVLDAVIPPKY